jgi:hypothetical protein
MSAASWRHCSPEQQSALTGLPTEHGPATPAGEIGYAGRAQYDLATMIYCVVPKPLVDELYDKLVERYQDDENVTVIIDRREADRRARGLRPTESDLQRRVIRDRRRARVAGDLPPLVDGS